MINLRTLKDLCNVNRNICSICITLVLFIVIYVIYGLLLSTFYTKQFFGVRVRFLKDHVKTLTYLVFLPPSVHCIIN